MNQQTIDQMRSMVEFSAGVGELLKERDELLTALVDMTNYISGRKSPDWIDPPDMVVIKPALIAIARARGKSTFGNDWWDALT